MKKYLIKEVQGSNLAISFFSILPLEKFKKQIMHSIYLSIHSKQTDIARNEEQETQKEKPEGAEEARGYGVAMSEQRFIHQINCVSCGPHIEDIAAAAAGTQLIIR
jgi:hypothetical protein